MALNLTRTFTYATGGTITASQNNTNENTLYNAFSGLEAKTSTITNIVVDTLIKSTGTIEVPNSGSATAPSYTFTSDTNTGIYNDGTADTVFVTTGGTARLTLNTASLTTTLPVLLPNGAVGAPSMTFTNDTDSGIYTGTGGTWYLVTQGAVAITIDAALTLSKDCNSSSAGGTNLGSATLYFNDISYKTLTDRGCLGWFDDGVELQDGRIVSDCQALMEVKKHPTKKTIYGVPMLDYKSFPRVAYKKADKITYGKDGSRISELLPRDQEDEPIGGSDGVEMTSMFSIVIGAIKELTGRVEALEK